MAKKQEEVGGTCEKECSAFIKAPNLVSKTQDICCYAGERMVDVSQGDNCHYNFHRCDTSEARRIYEQSSGLTFAQSQPKCTAKSNRVGTVCGGPANGEPILLDRRTGEEYLPGYHPDD